MLCNMHPHSWWCIYYIHITMSMSDNYIPGAKINLVRVPTYVRFMKRSSISTYYHIIYFPQCQDLFSRNVLGLAMRMFPPQRRYHPSVMSTDGLTVLATVCLIGTLSTIPQHFTETQWPTAARRWHFVLWDVSRRQSCHLSTPSHPRVPPA